MALQKSYPADFERVWASYPKHPVGRSKKEPSFRAFQKAKKDFGFTQSDIDELVLEIERRKKDCVTWQKGNRYGPEMFSTFFNQARWNEPYEKVRGNHYDRPVGAQVSDEDNARIFWQGEHRAGRDVPAKFQHYIERH